MMFIGCSNNMSRITSVFYVIDTWFPVKVLLDQSNISWVQIFDDSDYERDTHFVEIKPWQIASQHLNLRSLEAESDVPQFKFPDFGTNFPVKIWIDTLFYYVILCFTGASHVFVQKRSTPHGLTLTVAPMVRRTRLVPWKMWQLDL